MWLSARMVSEVVLYSHGSFKFFNSPDLVVLWLEV